MASPAGMKTALRTEQQPLAKPTCNAAFKNEVCVLLAHGPEKKHRSGRGVEWRDGGAR